MLNLLLASFAVLSLPQGEWPSFRGPSASGLAERSAEAPGPFDVESGKGVAWRVPVPGLSHSSPVVWGDRVFLTAAARIEGEAELSSLYGSEGYGAGESVENEGAHAFLVLAYDTSGKALWTREAHRGVPLVKRHPKSTHANPSPTCDGERVIASFASEGFYAFDHDGQPLWSRNFGVLDSGAPDVEDPSLYQWGFASSPVLHGDAVVLQCDVQGPSFLTLLDAATGADRWRVERDEPPTWGTPTVYTRADGKPAIVVNGYRTAASYDLATGKEQWTLRGGGDVPVPTPVVSEELVFLTSAHGRQRPIYAIRTDAEGVLTQNAQGCEGMEWSHLNRGVYMQTPLAYDGILYLCSDGGILTAYDSASGERLYRERLGTGTSGFSGSPVAWNDTLYLTAESGEVFLVRAGPEFELLGQGDLGENCLSTPAIGERHLYFRTRHHLVAVGPE